MLSITLDVVDNVVGVSVDDVVGGLVGGVVGAVDSFAVACCIR